MFAFMVWIAPHLVIKKPNNSMLSEPPTVQAKVLMWIEGTLLVITFVMAAATRKESRSDMIQQFLETGERCSGSGNSPYDPLARLFAMVVMLGLLQGEFLIIDSIKTVWLRFRLRNVDRDQAAVILGMLFAQPSGIDPRLLLRIGENPSHLRRTIAYLMTYEWGDISPNGDHLTLLSPAKRALRH